MDKKTVVQNCIILLFYAPIPHCHNPLNFSAAQMKKVNMTAKPM